MEQYGLTGNILKIDLTEQKAEIVKTGSYADLSGGAPLAYRILLEELPTAPENAFDPANPLVLAGGLLTGSGLPAACSLAVAGLSPAGSTPCCGQISGRLASMLRYAGYDAIIISGKAATPVWLNIHNNEVKVESASFLWGAGTNDTMAQICATTGPETAVAAIGPAGENKLDFASIVTLGGAAEGLGGVMGSKNLKAIAIRGSGAYSLPNPIDFPAHVTELCKTVIGVPGGSVVPAQSQSWSQYSNEKSWWNAADDLAWGASQGQVTTGQCAPGETARMGLRTLSVVRDFGPEAADAVVRPVACPGCTSGCATLLHLPALERAGLSPYQLCNCEGLRNARGFMPKAGELPQPEAEEEEIEGTQTLAELFAYSDLEIAAAAYCLAQEFGVGLLGGQLAKTFRFAVDSGKLEEAMSNAQYAALDWEAYQKGDLHFLTDFFRQLSKNTGKLPLLGSADAAEQLKLGKEYETEETAPIWGTKRPLDADLLHGAAEAALAALSPDELRRPMTQLLDCGLPAKEVTDIISTHCGAQIELEKERGLLVPKLSGELMAWSAKQSYLCSMLGLCPRMWPVAATSNAEEGYTADPELLAKALSVATGQDVPVQLLEDEALAGLSTARVLQCCHAKTLTPAESLDAFPTWVTEKLYTPGTVSTAFERLYYALGWDQTTGLPTGTGLQNLYLHKAADLLATVEPAE